MGMLIVDGNGQFWGWILASQWGLCSIVVHEPIELSFGIVSGMGPGIDVRNGGPHGSRQKGVLWGCLPHWSNGFNGLIFKGNVFNSCVKSWEYFCMDITLLESTFHWLSEATVKFEVDVRFYEKVTKMYVYCKMDVPLHGAAVRRQGNNHGCQLIFGAHCQS